MRRDEQAADTEIADELVQQRISLPALLIYRRQRQQQTLVSYCGDHYYGTLGRD